MRLFVIGASGYLGAALFRRALAAGHEVRGTAFANARGPLIPLDIRDCDAVERAVAEARPDVVVNTAAVQHDWTTTAIGPVHLAAACAATGARFVHVSSDAVFIGGDRDRYDEVCDPAPNTAYGAAKAAAEVAVAAVHPQALIVRTSWILGDGASPFEALVRSLAAGTATGALFDDDSRSPVHVGDLAAALLELSDSPLSGVLHTAGSDSCDRYTLGRLVAERDRLDPDTLPRTAKAAATGTPGATVVLDSSRAAAVLRVRLRGCQEFLRQGAATPPAETRGRGSGVKELPDASAPRPH